MHILPIHLKLSLPLTIPDYSSFEHQCKKKKKKQINLFRSSVKQGAQCRKRAKLSCSGALDSGPSALPPSGCVTEARQREQNPVECWLGWTQYWAVCKTITVIFPAQKRDGGEKLLRSANCPLSHRLGRERDIEGDRGRCKKADRKRDTEKDRERDKELDTEGEQWKRQRVRESQNSEVGKMQGQNDRT